MSQKTAHKPQKPLKERVIAAALSLAASMGWDMVSMADIASEAKTTLADLSDIFDDKGDILVAYGRLVDRRVLENAGQGSPEDSPRDRLFDIIMERFDILGEDRDAIVSILSAYRFDPKEAIIALPHLARSMAWMMEAAGIDVAGIKGAVRLSGLSALYAHVLWVWIRDESPDLAKTMAALDKDLSRAEHVAGTFMLS